MDRLTSLLLRLTPDERRELALEVAARVSSADDAAVEAEWMRALERRFGPEEPEQLGLWSSDRDAR
jgi:hypothetical protein